MNWPSWTETHHRAFDGGRKRRGIGATNHDAQSSVPTRRIRDEDLGHTARAQGVELHVAHDADDVDPLRLADRVVDQQSAPDRRLTRPHFVRQLTVDDGRGTIVLLW